MSLELAAEITFPIPADNSATLLFTVGIAVYFVLAMVIAPLLHLNTSKTCSSIFNIASYSICTVSIMGGLMALRLRTLFIRKEMSLKELNLRNIVAEL